MMRWQEILVISLMVSLPSGCSQSVENRQEQHEDAKRSPAEYRGKTVDEWIAILEDTENPAPWHAADVLGNIGPGAEAAVPALKKALGKPQLSNAAATALRKIGPPAAPALLDAMNDESMAVRLLATVNVGLVRPPQTHAVRALLKALQDESKDLRFAAVVGLAGMGPAAADAVPALVNAIENDTLEIKLVAATALGQIGPKAKASIPALQKLSQSREHVLREVAEKALGKIQK